MCPPSCLAESIFSYKEFIFHFAQIFHEALRIGMREMLEEQVLYGLYTIVVITGHHLTVLWLVMLT